MEKWLIAGMGQKVHKMKLGTLVTPESKEVIKDIEVHYAILSLKFSFKIFPLNFISIIKLKIPQRGRCQGSLSFSTF